MPQKPEATSWERFAARMAALGIDPLKPSIGEDDPHFDELHAILCEFGGVAPLPPLPLNWKGIRPVDYDGTVEGIGRWLEFEWRHTLAQSIFPGAGETSLDNLNEVIRNAYRAFAHFQIVDPPKREARATTIPVAKQRLEDLVAFVRLKMKSGWESPTTDRPKEGIVVIDRWANLGIGIDDDMKGKLTCYAFVPCPELGARVRLKDGVVLPLKGSKRWPKVLPCFARSDDGMTADIEELEMELGYWKKGDIRAAQALFNDEQAVFDEGLKEKGKTARRTLTTTMADLGEKLRKLVAPKHEATVFESNGPIYRAAFTTRHLSLDGDGNITFGRAE